MFGIDDLLFIGGSYLIGHALGTAAAAVIEFVIDVFIDEESLQDEIEERYPEAFKLLIKEKKKTAVNVGIFDVCDDVIESNVEISSSEGVSNDLYVGQEIYLVA